MNSDFFVLFSFHIRIRFQIDVNQFNILKFSLRKSTSVRTLFFLAEMENKIANVWCVDVILPYGLMNEKSLLHYEMMLVRIFFSRHFGLPASYSEWLSIKSILNGSISTCIKRYVWRARVAYFTRARRSCAVEEVTAIRLLFIFLDISFIKQTWKLTFAHKHRNLRLALHRRWRSGCFIFFSWTISSPALSFCSWFPTLSHWLRHKCLSEMCVEEKRRREREREKIVRINAEGNIGGIMLLEMCTPRPLMRWLHVNTHGMT